MDNQHKKIKGYRDLSQEEIDLMNEIKQKGIELGLLCDKLADSASAGDQTAEPLSWVSLGRRSLQTGLMQLTRSVARPGFF